jgi:hypothetical protein
MWSIAEAKLLGGRSKTSRSVSIYTFFKDIVMLVCVFGSFAGSLLT